MIEVKTKNGIAKILFAPYIDGDGEQKWKIRFIDEDGLNLDARWLPPRFDLPYSGFVIDDDYMFVWHCQNEYDHINREAAISHLLYQVCCNTRRNQKPPSFVKDLALLLSED